jgi:hypothetical protein
MSGGEQVGDRTPMARGRERLTVALWSLVGSAALLGMLLLMVLADLDIAVAAVARQVPIPTPISASTLLVAASYLGGMLERGPWRGAARIAGRTTAIVLLNGIVATMVLTLLDRTATGARPLLAALLGPAFILVLVLSLLLAVGVSSRAVNLIGLSLVTLVAALLVVRTGESLSALAGLVFIGYLVWSVIDELELRLRRGLGRWTPIGLSLASFDAALRGPARLVRLVLAYLQRG